MLRAAHAHVVDTTHRPKKGESPFRWGCDFTCRQRPTCCAHGISRWHVAHSYPRWIIRTAHHVHRSVLPNFPHGNQPLPIARVMLESFCRIEDGEDVPYREAPKHNFDSSKVYRFHVRCADPHENVSGSQTLRRTGDAATRLRPQGGSSIWSEAEREAAARAGESAGKGRHYRYSG